MTKRLVFIVEGDCEVAFVNRKVISYLYTLPEAEGWSMNVQKITTNRRLNAKGGNIRFELLKNKVDRVRSQKGPWITTFFDFFRLPVSFPGYVPVNKNVEKVETAMAKELEYDRLVPYIQKYEFETLLFADLSSFKLFDLCDWQIEALHRVKQEFPNIEDINGGEQTAPSKRLAAIFPYNKVSDSDILLENVSLHTLMDSMPRFKSWIETLESIIQENPCP